jgi:hypothetical protein
MSDKDTAQLELTDGTQYAEDGDCVGPIRRAPEPTPEYVPQESLTPQHICNLLESMAINPECDKEKLNAICDFAERIERTRDEREFSFRMSKAQSEVPPVVRDAHNDQTNSDYPRLESLQAAITPVYTAHGIFVNFGETDSPKDGQVRYTAEYGYGLFKKEVYIDLPPDTVGIKGSPNKTMVHGLKSSSTYAQGILLTRIFNITIVGKGWDDDGNGAAEMQITPAQEKEIGTLLEKLPERRRQKFFDVYDVDHVSKLSKAAAIVALLDLRKAVRTSA